MSNWTAGYVSDIDYTYGYYQELNPIRAQLALLNSGVSGKKVSTACELGYGQGLSANFHAASTFTEWYGTDFNPVQAGFAQELAEVSGANAKLYDQSFEEFCSRKDLPNFDYIALHGIWSWISNENRSIIVDFIRRKLNVGGIVYLSYNTLPGWSAFAPLRHLMTQHAEIIGSEGRGIVSRIDEALEFANKLMDTQPLFARAYPSNTDQLKKVSDQNRHYLAHEYFNKDWDPMHFASLASWLEPAKLEFAGSANFLDHFDAVNLSEAQQEFIAEVPDLKLKQSMRDFMVNQNFRRDYWVRGARKIPALEQFETWIQSRFVMLVDPSEITFKVRGGQGEVNLNESIYKPIIENIADRKVFSVGELCQKLKKNNIEFPAVREALLILSSNGQLAPVQDEQLVSKIRKRVDKLNQHLMHKARSSNEISVLLSPLTGAGIGVNRFSQMFLSAYNNGTRKPEELAASTWKILAGQNQRLTKEGSVLQSDEENMAELTSQAGDFINKLVPVLKAAQIV